MRIRAPELAGRGWLNTGGEPLTLRGLRGRIVLLDFWTFCCVNCLHVLDELRPLEEEFAEELVVIGVHSPKFAHEADPGALAAAVERYDVHHPVLDDPTLRTWSAYTARAWPTLVVVDPQGYVAASLSGEGHAHGLRLLVRDLVDEHEAMGTLRRGGPAYVAAAETGTGTGTVLRFPGKVARCDDGSFLVSDTAHHEVVRVEPDLAAEDSRYRSDLWADPQGICVLPDVVAARVGYDVVVADSLRHQVTGLRLADGAVTLLAGTGRQLRERGGGGPALRQDLSTPWDLAWWLDRVVVAMAGTHQLWVLHLARDPEDNTVALLAGTSAEGIRDGAAHDAWFAQPSGLAVSADGSRLWVADSESSALRSVVLADDGFQVHTHVGRGLFEFGHRDGPASAALLQHPLGAAVLPDGSVAVCDTYNGAVRRYDPVADVVSTLAKGLDEPSGAVVADGDLVVVESGAHRLRRVPLDGGAVVADGPAHQTTRPPTELVSGPVTLRVRFTPPPGQVLDDRYGDPTQLMVSASPGLFLRSGDGTAPGLVRVLDLDPRVGSGILHVSVRAAACDGHAEDEDEDEGAGDGDDSAEGGGAAKHAACHLYQQDWGIPVVLTEGAGDALTLDLRAT